MNNEEQEKAKEKAQNLLNEINAKFAVVDGLMVKLRESAQKVKNWGKVPDYDPEVDDIDSFKKEYEKEIEDAVKQLMREPTEEDLNKIKL